MAIATQQQRQLTEAERKLAEDQRYEAEISRAQTDNAYRNALSLTPAQFIQLESINMPRTACAQDPGYTFIIGSSLTPVLSVGKIEIKLSVISQNDKSVLILRSRVEPTVID